MQPALFPILFLALSTVSLWFTKRLQVWGLLAIFCLISAHSLGLIDSIALIPLLGWAILWFTSDSSRKGVFVVFVLLSFGFKFHLFPGFHPVAVTPKFFMGIDSSWVGLFPLALILPLAKNSRDWKEALTRGFWLTAGGIAVMAIAATAVGTTHFVLKWPSHAPLRYLSNLILTAAPEEAFYRGYVQTQLCRWLPQNRKGTALALIASSLIFTLAHLYWSPSIGVFVFVFLAGLLYGGVYLISGRIESAILCHFLLNFVHMTFFSYHAM